MLLFDCLGGSITGSIMEFLPPKSVGVVYGAFNGNPSFNLF